MLVSCQKDGCSFEGTRKLVREHEEDRHLIFAEGREPKPYVATYKASEGCVWDFLSLRGGELMSAQSEDRGVEHQLGFTRSDRAVDRRAESALAQQASRRSQGPSLSSALALSANALASRNNNDPTVSQQVSNLLPAHAVLEVDAVGTEGRADEDVGEEGGMVTRDEGGGTRPR